MSAPTAEALRQLMGECSAKESALAPFVAAGLVSVGEGHLGYDLTDTGRALLAETAECNADGEHSCDAGSDGEPCPACQRYMAEGMAEAARSRPARERAAEEAASCSANNCGDPVVADGLCRACLATQARFERAAKGAS